MHLLNLKITQELHLMQQRADESTHAADDAQRSSQLLGWTGWA
jgi:hypothetical protein